ncbi:Insecticidal toxin complex protein [Flavivirga aquimarina]|uniref:Insecticidal toxin complex protein n=1 Tax=Flavivirga aquimarina TaxID=2027862 RepID=A0ABT8WBB9_9FLAO|nr:Insecticidal toxin complex protein [Flavivirga aquimarina]MDO5970446.1 Insecticidal toxin complex protein [Flavivirga aquimarina]
MIRQIVFALLITLNSRLSAKEWKSLKAYQKETQKEHLAPSDWLRLDRIQNTISWQNANKYNLINNLPQEYLRIVERRDFYKWLFETYNKQEHEVMWVKMAHFISRKLRLMESFPYSIFANRQVLQYAKAGSKTVFNNVFIELQNIFNSDIILKDEEATKWDEKILYKEQYIWLESVYKTIDERSLKKMERIAKGVLLYGLVVPKAIRFKNKLSNSENRYNYAVEVLRPYCINGYK